MVLEGERRLAEAEALVDGGGLAPQDEVDQKLEEVVDSAVVGASHIEEDEVPACDPFPVEQPHVVQQHQFRVFPQPGHDPLPHCFCGLHHNRNCIQTGRGGDNLGLEVALEGEGPNGEAVDNQ